MKRILLISSFFVAAAALPLAAFADAPVIAVDTDARELSITYNTDPDHLQRSEISFPKKVKDIQAVSIKRNEEFYVVALVRRKKKVFIQLYTDSGEKLAARQVFRAQKKRRFENIKLDVQEDGDTTLFRARAIVLKKKGKPVKLLTRRYTVRPNKSKAISKRDAAVEQIAFVEPENALEVEQEGMAMLNYFRMAIGEMPVTRRKKLNEGCELHAEYMRLNETITHYEQEGEEGYTDKGELAGRQSNLAALRSSNEMRTHVELWIEAIYHRLPMKSRGLESVGWAISDKADNNYYYSCLNVLGDTAGNGALQDRNVHETVWNPKNHKPIPYPGVGQEYVPTRFDGGENPNPIKAFEDAEYPVGQPVSLTFSPNDTVKNMSMTLKDKDGNTVAGYFRAPNDENDPNEQYQGNSVTFIAEEALENDAVYRVRVAGKRNGKDYLKKWRFHTATAEFDSSKR